MSELLVVRIAAVLFETLSIVKPRLRRPLEERFLLVSQRSGCWASPVAAVRLS